MLALSLLLSGCINLPLTVEKNPDLPVIELGGYSFHGETVGNDSAPVLIVLHGGPGADYKYLKGLAELGDDYLVVFYDQRGSGLSPRVPSSEISVQSFIDDLDLFVEKFGKNKPIHLLGHSWGAMLAAAYASAHPQKVTSMVLAEPQFLDQSTIDALGGSPSLRVIWGVAQAWLAKWRVDADGDIYARDDYFLSRLMILIQSPKELCNGKLPNLEANRFGSPVFEATIGRVMRDKEFAASLTFVDGIENYQGKTLFMTGACNQLFGSNYQAQHLHFFSDVTLEEVPNAGHFMFNDQPEHSMKLVRTFLESTKSSPAH